MAQNGSKELYRIYTDVNGKRRKLKSLRQTYYFVEWSKEHPESICTIWQDESGQELRIPDNAWTLINFQYVDILE